MKAGSSIKYTRSFLVKDRTVYEFVLEKPVSDEVFYRIYRSLVYRGYMPIQLDFNGEPVLRIIPLKKRKTGLKRLVLTILTILTVGLTGYGLTESFYSLYGGLDPLSTTLWSILYVVLFLGTLALHELGHLVMAKKYSVPASGPYFIPAPPIQLGFIGTLGAVISLEGLPPNRKSLGLLGIAGPLAGFLTATLICVIGILLSPTISVEKAEEMIESGELSEIPYMPLIFLLLLSIKQTSVNEVLIIHPLAFIAFIIYVVTFLNLMPIGQLDGGHVVRVFTSALVHSIIGNVVIMAMAISGLMITLMGYNGLFYIVLSIILLVFKMIFGSRPHPGSANMYSRVDKVDYMILTLYIVLVILCAPIPVL